MSQNGQFKELCERLGLHESIVTMVVATMAKRFDREHAMVVQALLGTAKVLAGAPAYLGEAVELLESMASRWQGEILRLTGEVERNEAEAISRGLPGSIAADALRMHREGVSKCHAELERLIVLLKRGDP